MSILDGITKGVEDTLGIDTNTNSDTSIGTDAALTDVINVLNPIMHLLPAGISETISLGNDLQAIEDIMNGSIETDIEVLLADVLKDLESIDITLPIVGPLLEPLLETAIQVIEKILANTGTSTGTAIDETGIAL